MRNNSFLRQYRAGFCAKRRLTAYCHLDLRSSQLFTSPADTQADQVLWATRRHRKESAPFLWLFGCVAQEVEETGGLGRECLSNISNGSYVWVLDATF